MFLMSIINPQKKRINGNQLLPQIRSEKKNVLMRPIDQEYIKREINNLEP